MFRPPTPRGRHALPGLEDCHSLTVGHVGFRKAEHGGHSFVGRGLYASQLRPWLRLFGPDQLLVITLEQLDTVPSNREMLQATMGAVQLHVGLPCEPIADPAPQNQRGGAATSGGGGGGGGGGGEAAVAKPAGVGTPEEQHHQSALEQLASYYRPYNAELCSLLEEVWPTHGAGAGGGLVSGPYGSRRADLQATRVAAMQAVREWQ